ncbi:MAG: redox-regulated ATPase YchF [Blastocatellia bacterium]|nr:redox-regulated ATPase YchF [Blastocatellia bacterium]MDW8257745.1 redox-regulated ATPase YchF [Acidobacteriota bacterium]
MLRVGIIGLPNVGKSTLFNALVRGHVAEVASYPFSTVERNVGIIAVPDERLALLARVYRTSATVPSTIEFVDIAGLVRGAHRGEGLGNQFLAHIREMDALVEVVRCFEAESVAHVEGVLDPIRDMETVEMELALADLATVERRKEKAQRQAKVGDKTVAFELAVLEKLEAALNAGTPVRRLSLSEEERAIVRQLFLLTAKPKIYAANVGEEDLGRETPCVARVREQARAWEADVVVLCAQLEAELTDLTDEEAAEYLAGLGVTSTGVRELIHAAYRQLGLITFFTGNEKEVRAWAVKAGTKAPQAAGLIHSDFERGFIAAEVIPFKDLIAAGSIAKAREHGLIRLEGRDYVVQEGDVIYFRFHVS